jgi:hypothetical protein
LPVALAPSVAELLRPVGVRTEAVATHVPALRVLANAAPACSACTCDLNDPLTQSKPDARPATSLNEQERCTTCPGVASVVNAGNFSEYTARMMSVATVGAGAVSGTGSSRYYSFNQGLTHFLVFTAEAYTYNSGATFLANQLAFMKRDLASVDRTVTPWVVGLAHKAWWMESNAYADFTPVLIAGGVDIVFTGHYHYCALALALRTRPAAASHPLLPRPLRLALHAVQQHDGRGRHGVHLGGRRDVHEPQGDDRYHHGRVGRPRVGLAVR